MRENILMTSNAFRASAKIYGNMTEDRALPVQRCPAQLKTVFKQGKWRENGPITVSPT